MAFPQFRKKYNEDVIITPLQHLQAEAKALEGIDIPESVILCFESSIIDHYKNLNGTHQTRFWTGEIIYLDQGKTNTAIVGNFGIGGPAAAHMMEILIAAGVRNFIVVGHAGGLQESNPPGTIVLCDKSIRDEGLSYHYAAPSEFASATDSLTQKLKGSLDRNEVGNIKGTSWTIDSMYRETLSEIKHYKGKGITTVEMELASLFAVATFREVEMAALLVISDYVGLGNWEEHLDSAVTSNALFKAVDVAIQTLVK